MPMPVRNAQGYRTNVTAKQALSGAKGPGLKEDLGRKLVALKVELHLPHSLGLKHPPAFCCLLSIKAVV